MAKYMHSKIFQCKGWLQDIRTMGMMPCKFNVLVSNDKHCTVSVVPDEKADIPIQYCVDFTKVLKALEGTE
jgi:hypothetical protein